MAKLDAYSNQFWNGSNGEIWVNSIAFDKVSSFELEMELEWEDVPEQLTTGRVLMGYGYTGNLTYRKTDSNYNSGIELLFTNYQNGVIPEVEIIAKAYNRASGNTQRIRIYGITFDNLPIQQWEEKSIVEVDMDFSALGVEILQ